MVGFCSTVKSRQWLSFYLFIPIVMQPKVKINILSQIIQGEWLTLIAVVVGEWVSFSE